MGVGHPDLIPLSPRQITEAWYYDRLGTVADDRADRRAARNAYPIYRVTGGKRGFSDFYADPYAPPRRPQTEAELKAALRSYRS